MPDITIPIRVLEVTDGTEPGEEAMGDIDGDSSPRNKVPDILVYQVSGSRVLKFCIKHFPPYRLFSWGEDSLDDEGVGDVLRDLHLVIQELNDREGHCFRVI